MASLQDKALKLQAALKVKGIYSYYDASRARMTPGMTTLEISLGIAGAEKTFADCDTLVQFTNMYDSKISARLFDVPYDKAPEMAIACNAANAAVQFAKFYVAPDMPFLFAEWDFISDNDSFVQQVVDILPKFKDSVNKMQPLIKMSLSG